MHIQFTGNAQVRGVGYRRGDVAELDPETCKAYIEAGQAKPYTEPKRAKGEDADSDEDTGDDEKPKTESTNRGGRNVRKATKAKGEQR